MPLPRLPNGTRPVTSTPMKFPSVTKSPNKSEMIKTPLRPLAEITFRDPNEFPPMIKNCTPPPAASRAVGSKEIRSEEHTSELQSLTNLVCRLLLEKKKKKKTKTKKPTPPYKHK